MALRFFKSFYESLSNDKDVLSINGTINLIDTPYGKGISAFRAGASTYYYINLDALGGIGQSLNTLGANTIHYGYFSNSGQSNLGGINIVPAFDSSGGGVTYIGKPLGAGWHWVEARLTRIPGTTTTYTRQVRLDGEEYVNDTPNLANIWSANPLSLTLSAQSGVTFCPEAHFSSPIVWDSIDDGSAMTTWMGPMLVSVLRPSGSGAKSQWLGSDGNSVDNFALVDETPVSTVDYVESSTDGEQDLYVHAGMADGYTPLGVRQVVYAQKNGANLKSMKLVMSQPNGDGTTTDTIGDEEILNDAARFISSKVFGLNPKTNLPWTPTEINALQFGVESSTPVQ